MVLAISHLVKVGVLGHVGRLSAPSGRQFSRDDQVICRTVRGLELGAVLCVEEKPPAGAVGSEQYDGELLRRVTPDDSLILTRIDKFRDRAFEACSRLLQERGLQAVLVDVEHLFDGQSLFFYFLGEVPDEVHQLTNELADAYEKKVKFRKFTETLASGCGPDCGTEAAKCFSGGFSSCGLSSACKSGTTESKPE